MRVLAAGIGRRGELLERLEMFLRQHGALAVDPSVELVVPGEVKAVEKRTGVHPNGVLRSPRAERRGEFGDVARDQLGVEAQLLDAEDHVVGAELVTERVDRPA